MFTETCNLIGRREIAKLAVTSNLVHRKGDSNLLVPRLDVLEHRLDVGEDVPHCRSTSGDVQTEFISALSKGVA
jgi:hypothetical protein